MQLEGQGWHSAPTNSQFLGAGIPSKPMQDHTIAWTSQGRAHSAAQRSFSGMRHHGRELKPSSMSWQQNPDQLALCLNLTHSETSGCEQRAESSARASRLRQDTRSRAAKLIATARASANGMCQQHQNCLRVHRKACRIESNRIHRHMNSSIARAERCTRETRASTVTELLIQLKKEAHSRGRSKKRSCC